ncbi:MAG: glycosyltransferase family 2 protein, partial [Actinomycetales bacterium]
MAVVTHNGLPWAMECMESVFEQTRPPDIVVVVDDHSSDGTVEALTGRYGRRISIVNADASVRSLATHARIA